MKKTLLFLLLTIISCKDFSLLQRDQKNIFFHKNISNETHEYLGELSIATYNIKLGFCQNCDPFSGSIGGTHEHLDQIAEFINSLDLDIISMQEVGYEYSTSIIENQIKYLAQKTNMNYSYGMGRALQTGDNLFLSGFIGNAILSKYEILDVKNPSIRYIDYFNQNHCLKVKLKLSVSKEITILNTHFESGSTDDEKLLQINRIKEITKKTTDGPIIFTGDLNLPYSINSYYLEILDSDFYNSLEKINNNQRKNIINSGTFINGSILDYIFIDKNNFSILSGKLAPQEYRNISDHYPYIVRLAE